MRWVHWAFALAFSAQAFCTPPELQEYDFENHKVGAALALNLSHCEWSQESSPSARRVDERRLGKVGSCIF